MSQIEGSKNGQKTGLIANDVKYVIKVKTGSLKNSGTNSTVSITIFGNKTKTDKINLKESKNPGKLFEKSRTDEFHVKAKNVGQVN